MIVLVEDRLSVLRRHPPRPPRGKSAIPNSISGREPKKDCAALAHTHHAAKTAHLQARYSTNARKAKTGVTSAQLVPEEAHPKAVDLARLVFKPIADFAAIDTLRR